MNDGRPSRDEHGSTPACVITGVGLITPVGEEPEQVFERVLWGPPAAGLITRFDTSRCRCRIGAEVEHVPALHSTDDPPLSRGVALLTIAAIRALCDADLISFAPLALCLGGGGSDWEPADSGDLQQHLCLSSSVPMALRILAERFGVSGRQIALYGASASGAQAVAEAKWLIEAGEAPAVLVGGYDAMLNPLAFGMLDRLGLLSRRNDDPKAASRPFDADRDGFVLGEGAGALVLETEDHALRRGVRLYGRLLGVGVANGAHHWIDPPADPAGAVAAMRAALEDSGLSSQSIDHILAYGSSSPAYDALETRALKTAFGSMVYDLSVSSTKGALGYLAGASGVVDVIVGLFALRTQLVPPTLNYSEPDLECDLDYVPRIPRRKRLRAVLCNSFGLGGQYVSLIVGEADV